MAKRSPAEIKAWREKMGKVAKLVRAMTTAEREGMVNRMGLVTCEGRGLSWFNQCFLWYQAGEGISMVGGFRQWQKVGRMVRKGEHACGYIYVPIVRKAKDVEPGDDGEVRDDVRFRLVPMFDVAQTEVKADAKAVA